MKIYTFNTALSYPAKTQNFTPKTNSNTTSTDKQGLAIIPSNYHKQRFEADKKLSSINFKGIKEGSEMFQLKNSLNKICKEIIHRYNEHDEAISENLYARGFVKHCFDFTEKEGDDYHNIKDPFNPENWSSYYYSKNKTTANGKTLCNAYTEKMKSKIDSWNQNFIQIITKEKQSGDNNLLDDLLNSNDDIEKIKNYLGIK